MGRAAVVVKTINSILRDTREQINTYKRDGKKSFYLCGFRDALQISEWALNGGLGQPPAMEREREQMEGCGVNHEDEAEFAFYTIQVVEMARHHLESANDATRDALTKAVANLDEYLNKKAGVSEGAPASDANLGVQEGSTPSPAAETEASNVSA